MSESGGEGGAGKEVSDTSLRHVEKDILISQMIRKKSHEVCYEPYVRGIHVHAVLYMHNCLVCVCVCVCVCMCVLSLFKKSKHVILSIMWREESIPNSTIIIENWHKGANKYHDPSMDMKLMCVMKEKSFI